MPKLTRIVFNQKGEFTSIPADQTGSANPQSVASAQECTSIQKSPQQNETIGNAEANVDSPSFTIVESICKNKEEPPNRLVTFVIHGVPYHWDIDVGLEKLHRFYTYAIAKESQSSFIHNPIKSDILLKYGKLKIPISVESKISEARLAQEACVVSVY